MEALKESKPSRASHKIFTFSNLVVSFGILMVTVGGGWDISNHLLNKPETFFAPPHALLYSGVAIALIGTTLMFFRWIGFDSETKSRYSFPVKISLLGIFILGSAGPIDFVWHSNFGLDGLLSPPHITLISGMFLCSFGAMISLARIGKNSRQSSYNIHHFFVIIAILPLWMVLTGYSYSFSLPFSNSEFFEFNPEVYFAVTFATIVNPLIISSMLLMSAKLAHYKFGILSMVGGLLLLINVGNSIMPNPSLENTIPFYLFTFVPFVIADIMLSMSQKKTVIWSAGAILGSTFYFVYFPLITHVYNEVVFDRIVSASQTSMIYFEMMPIVFPITIGPAIIVGILGTKIADKIIEKILK